jgi:hypothetical protein
MAGELGKATLELDVTGFAQFEGKIEDARASADRLEDKLKGLATVSDVTGHMLGHVEITPGQAAKSVGSVAAILEGVHGLSDEARDAARELDDVKINESTAAESVAAGDEINENLDKIDRKANAARRSLDRVRIASGRPGVGVGAFGSGYGRVGLLGTAIGAGVLTGPAAAPALGALAGLPTLAAGAVGVVGTLVLALKGMGKAIDGDYKAYKQLQPEQQQFVLTIRSLIPWIDRLKEKASEGLVPGLTEGLKSALSPGTVSVIEGAVGAISSALGQAAATWGAYLGSPEFQSIFGPLMVDAARNLGVMSVAALHLFDALGVLGRAAIPLTDWITDQIAKGSQLVDAWIHAKDASGELAHGLDEAKTSLSLVGGLLVAAARAVGALGIVLYPVAQVAVKVLTDGLNSLSGWLIRNEDTIRTLVGGALADLVAVLRVAGQVLDAFYKSMQRDLGDNAPIVAGILAIGAALLLVFGPGAVVIAGAIFAAGEIIRNWDKVKQFFANFGQFMINVFSSAWTGIKGIFNLGIYAVLINLAALTKGLEKALGWIPGIGGKIKNALQQVDGFIESFRERGVAEFQAAGAQMGDAWGGAFDSAASKHFDSGHGVKSGPVLNPTPSETTKKANEPAPGSHAWYIKYLGYDPTATPSTSSVFGKPPAFDKNLPAAKDLEVPLALQLRQAEADASGIQSKQRAAAAAIKKWAESMISSGHLTTKQHIQALDLIAQENQALTSQFEIPLGLQLRQAAADASGIESKQKAVSAAIVAWAKKMIRSGKLTTEQHIQALQLIAQQQTSADFQVPLSLQVQEAKANASGVESKQKAAARAIKNWAQRMIKSGKLTTDELVSAYNLIAQENSVLGQKLNTAARGANEAQFLSSFAQIVEAYAPNAFPQPAEQSGGKTNTHLYDIKHETRQQTKLLSTISKRGRFPATDYAGLAAGAVTG